MASDLPHPAPPLLALSCPALCRRVEEPVAAHLEAEGLQFIQFAFRWVNCLLLREVPFPLAVRLWDTSLSEGSQLKDFLAYTLAAFLLR